MKGIENSSDMLETPEECLWRATQAHDMAARASFAREGLAFPVKEVTPSVRVLLLRQLYLAAIHRSELDAALEYADQMVSCEVMRDTAYHDRSRVLFALERVGDSIRDQRAAARRAPAARRSFHYWCLATLHHHASEWDSALKAFDRGLRWAKRDRPLLEAHRALVCLESGSPVSNLRGVVQGLLASPNRDGYGRYVIGMLFTEMGDLPAAAVHLRAFLHRNAGADEAKVLTLRRELDRARAQLARYAS